MLHGYVPYTTASLGNVPDVTKAYLAAVETGSELMYTGTYEDTILLKDTQYNTFYNSAYSLWAKSASDRYSRYAPLLKKVYDKTIVRHEEVLDDVYLTTYEDSTQVIVNYNEEAVTINGQTVSALGFDVGEGIR